MHICGQVRGRARAVRAQVREAGKSELKHFPLSRLIADDQSSGICERHRHGTSVCAQTCAVGLGRQKSGGPIAGHRHGQKATSASLHVSGSSKDLQKQLGYKARYQRISTGCPIQRRPALDTPLALRKSSKGPLSCKSLVPRSALPLASIISRSLSQGCSWSPCAFSRDFRPGTDPTPENRRPARSG